MTTELSNEQRRELQQHGGNPIEVIDPETRKTYVIIAGELYDKFRSVFDDHDFDIRETYAAQGEAAAATGWDDPEMDVYNDYDADKNQQ